ncbi:MAG: cell shape-determining protein [Bacteroidia bacterium]|nr:MAG: cell shape-determining protein [Bacteroidia bacterium]
MFELAAIVIFGIIAQWIAWKAKVPSILPLIITGLLVGPISTLFTEDGRKWIDPIYDATTQTGLFPQHTFFFFVSLSIGLVLFEGGLTLKLKELKNLRKVIIRLISVGPFVTLLGAGIFTHYLIGLNWKISFLFAGLITVTGPTVITPILRNLSIKKKVATVLKWEGILIDPVGALIAVLLFDFILSESNSEFTFHALVSFGKILIIGGSFGFTAAHFFNFLHKVNLIPHYLLNVFSLALVLAVFVFSDILAPESGLLAVVVMGLVLGNLNAPYVKEILDFKESINILLISILFITLSANINIDDLLFLLNVKVLILFIIIIFVLRPAAVFLSAVKTNLTISEKMYVSLMGPRGIVAAGIASLFGIKLTGFIVGAELIAPLVFMIVLGTVLFSASTAKFFMKIFKLSEDTSNRFVLIGANYGARLIARYLQTQGKNVILLDNSKFNVNQSINEKLEAFKADIYSETILDDLDLPGAGYMLSMTPSAEVNKYALSKFRKDFGKKGAYRLISTLELNGEQQTEINECAFSNRYDYEKIDKMAKKYPFINEYTLKTEDDAEDLLRHLISVENSLPLFIKNKKNEIQIIPAHSEKIEMQPEDILVYMGEELSTEK